MHPPRPNDVISHVVEAFLRRLSPHAKRRLLLATIRTIGRRLTPPRLARAADVLARIAVGRDSERARVVAANLNLLLDTSTPSQTRAEVQLAALRTIYANWLDLAWMSALTAPLPDTRVRLSGTERIDAARAGGRGVLMVSFHMGRFEIGAAAVAAKVGGLVSVSRVMPSPVVQDVLTTARTAAGNGDMVFVDNDSGLAAAGRLMRTLRQQGVVAVMVERYVVGPRVSVPFFGGRIALARGPVMMAVRGRAAILPSFAWQENGVTRVHIGDEVPVAAGATDADRCEATLQEIARVFEARIRSHPHEWHLDRPLVVQE